MDVRALSAFVDISKSVFRAEKAAAEGRQQVPAVVTGRSAGWFAWLKPALAMPVFAALLAIIAYQNLVTIPNAKSGVSSASSTSVIATAETQPANFSRLQMSDARRAAHDEKAVLVKTNPKENLVLGFDFTPNSTFENYEGQLQDQDKKTVLTVHASGDKTNKELYVVVPAGMVHPGRYTLVFFGVNDMKQTTTSSNQVATFPFDVEF